MKTEVKRRWIEALRSGEYGQVKATLAVINEDGSPIGYCCLGVLCDLVGEEAGAPSTIENGRIKWGMAADMPPPSIREYAGLPEFSTYDYSFSLDYDPRDTDPYDARGYRVGLFLPELNDEGFTFDQIADIIEWGEPEE